LVTAQIKTKMIKCVLTLTDTPYENVKEGQAWWKTVDLSADEKEMVGRTNAIRLYKLPLEE
jgi:2,3-dihydroxybenzoate decarboxylase